MRKFQPFPNAITCAVLCLMASSAYAQSTSAETSEKKTNELETINVIGIKADGLRPQTVEAGTFAGADIMDVPSNVNVITREALDIQGATGTYEALRNTAGVTRQQNGGDTWDQLVIRGISVENRTNYRLNGSLPLMNFSQVPLEDKERVEVLKGTSALYYGFTSPAGIVNYVTKRATDKPITSIGLTFDQYGTALASVDLGRKFGEQKQFGLRINAAGGNTGNYMHGVDNGSRNFISMAFDWQATDRLSFKADIEHDHRQTIEQAGVSLTTKDKATITQIPEAINPRNAVTPNWTQFKTESTNVLLRADYKLTNNWGLALEAGHAETNRVRNLAIFTFNTLASLKTGAGTLAGTSQDVTVTSEIYRIETNGSVKTGSIYHDVTLGVSYSEMNQNNNSSYSYNSGAQNLYTPTLITKIPAMTTKASSPYLTNETGLYAMDRITINDQWQLIGGVRHSDYHSQQSTGNYDAVKTTPMMAVIYKPIDNLSLYASVSQGLEEGEAAPTGTLNNGERLKPGISKQQEIGAKYLFDNGTLLTGSLFNIDSPGYYTNTDSVYVADGRKVYTGIELSAQGQLTKQLGWIASTQWLDPRFKDINDKTGAYNGKLPENAAKRTGSLFLNYALTSVPGLSVNAGAYYTGRRPMNDLNQAWLGSVTLFALGSRYETMLYGKRNTFQLNIENLADKEYWAGGGNRLAAGAPRTIRLTYKLDL